MNKETKNMFYNIECYHHCVHAVFCNFKMLPMRSSNCGIHKHNIESNDKCQHLILNIHGQFLSARHYSILCNTFPKAICEVDKLKHLKCKSQSH